MLVSASLSTVGISNIFSSVIDYPSKKGPLPPLLLFSFTLRRIAFYYPQKLNTHDPHGRPHPLLQP